MKSILVKFEILNGLIVLDKKSKENIYKSIRNIPNIKTTNANHFSVYDIVKYKKLIFHEICQQEKHLKRENLHSEVLILLKIFEFLVHLYDHLNRKEKNRM